MQKGDQFPHFVLQDENGETVDSKQLLGLRYIVFFYARDNTPGCTTEAVDFTTLYANFAMRNVLIFGVSGDSVASHRKFKDKHGLKEKLLSDPDHEFAKACGAYGEKKNYGKIVQGTIRKATGHAQRVLDGMVSHFKTDTAEDLPF